MAFTCAPSIPYHPWITTADAAQIAYNNYDRAPFRLPPNRMGEFYRALALFPSPDQRSHP